MANQYEDRDYGRYDRDDDRYGRRADYGYGGSYSEGSRQGYGGYGGGGGRDYGREDFGYGRGGYGGREYDRGYTGGSYGTGSGRGYGGGYGADYGRDYGDYGYGSGRTYGGGYYGRSGYDRERYGRDYEGGRSREDRGWWDRASDEVASWFGDEEAERRRRMDERRARHRGRGPKGYRRSDDRIKEDVSDRLSDDWYLDASDIEVNVDSGEVTLSGTVDSRSDKRRAEDLAESVSGVTNVENRLRVKQRDYGTNTSAGTTGMNGITGTTGTTATTGTASAARAGATGTGSTGRGSATK